MVSARTVADLTDTDISLPTGNALVFAEIDEVFEDTPTRLVDGIIIRAVEIVDVGTKGSPPVSSAVE